MTYSNAYQRQIENRNFLSPTGFKFVLNRAPKVAFFSNQANIPGITLGEATQPTYLKDIPVPGDKIVFDDLTLNFLVDEELKNYIAQFGYKINTEERTLSKSLNDLMKKNQRKVSKAIKNN